MPTAECESDFDDEGEASDSNELFTASWLTAAFLPSFLTHGGSEFEGVAGRDTSEGRRDDDATSWQLVLVQQLELAALEAAVGSRAADPDC